jgi:hypothetical protein
MAAARLAAVGALAVTVRELTFSEVRDWLVETETGQDEDPLHALALEECSLADLARMSTISVGELEGYAPSDLAELIAACKALNPHFFRVRAALSGVARLMLREAEQLSLTAPPASS